MPTTHVPTWEDKLSQAKGLGSSSPSVTIGSNTPTVQAIVYALGRVIGGVQAIPLYPVQGSLINLEHITLKFKGSIQTGKFWVALFSAPPVGTFNDNAAPAIAAADTASLIDIFEMVTPVSALGTHTIFHLNNIRRTIQAGPATTNIYAVVVAETASIALGSTSDMTLEIGTV